MDRQTFGGGQGWICPECGKQNKAESNFCTGCGRRMPNQENPHQGAYAGPGPGFDQGGYGNNAYQDPRNTGYQGPGYGGYYGPNGYDPNGGGYTPPEPQKQGGALKIIAIVLACLLAAAAIGFGVSKILLDRKDDPQPGPGDGTEQLAGDEDGDEDTTGTEEPAEGDYRTAYAEVLRLNEAAIRNYDWQTDYKRNPMTNNVLLYDLNGDDTPELLFFASEEAYAADFHVFTMENGEAVECDYYVDADHMNHPETGLMRDAHAAAGTRYMVYTGKEKGVFYIAHYISDTMGSYYSVKCKMGSDGTISEENYVYNYVSLEDPDIDEYTVDDEDVKMEKGVAVLKAHREDYDDLLMASGYDKDMKVFNKLKNDSPYATDYDDVMGRLGV